MTNGDQTAIHDTAGVVVGWPRTILRLEGLALVAAAVVGFQAMGGSWWWFAGGFLIPDVSMAGYVLGRRAGAAIYNLAHTTLLPAVLIGAAMARGDQLLVAVGLIWIAHIGFDRAVGYGLKYETDFFNTHLGGPLAAARQS